MSHKFLFVITSKDDRFKLNSDDFAGLENVKTSFISNNSDKLSVVYNRELCSARESGEFDYIVFIHADAALDIKHFISHIESVHGKYDVIGLCGTSVINVSQSPLNWYTGSRLNLDKCWGCVTHTEQGMSFFSKDRSYIEDHEVACIDGVCIVFGPKALADGSLKFDEKFSFDFYDTDISFQCLMKQNLKVGVLVEPTLVHDSVGKSILADEFLAHEIDFREKWGLEIPKNTKIEQIYHVLRPNAS